jgi:hypothetical protein
LLPTILASNQDISLSHVIFFFLKPWMKIERQSSPSTWLVVVCGFIPSGISGKSLDPVEMQSHLQQRRSPSCRQTARARPSPHSPPPATRSPRSRCSAPAGSVTTARAAHRGRARLRAVVHLEEHAAARRDCPACSRRCASACLRPPPCSGAGDGPNSPATPARANLAGKH